MSRPLLGSIVSVPAGDIHVRVEGPEAAPVLVLLHGFASSTHWWDRVTPALAEGHRVVRLDLLGHGASPTPSTGYGPEDQAAMVEQVLAALAIDQAVVAGHSMGAAIAVALAERSVRVGSLILVNEGPGYEVNTFPRLQHLLLRPVIGDLLTRHPPRVITRHGLSVAFAPDFDLASAFDDLDFLLVDAHLEHVAFRGGLVEKRRYTDVRPLDVRLADLALPTLVVWGVRDRLWSTTRSLSRYRAVANLELHLIDEAGHTPQIETPAEVVDAILGFTTLHDTEDAS